MESCHSGFSVGKALGVARKKDMGQWQVLAAEVANSSLGCMNRSKDRG